MPGVLEAVGHGRRRQLARSPRCRRTTAQPATAENGGSGRVRAEAEHEPGARGRVRQVAEPRRGREAVPRRTVASRRPRPTSRTRRSSTRRVDVLRRPEDQPGPHQPRPDRCVTGWSYLPYQVYANSIFGDTVGKAYADEVRPEPRPEGLAGRARRRTATSRASRSTADPVTHFAIGETDFLLDGRPFRILSGALHYFRVHPEQWADRIQQGPPDGTQHHRDLRAVERAQPAARRRSTPPGCSTSSGSCGLVAAAGLHAIVRPGPYICAEWDNGGLPAWLFRRARHGSPPLRAARSWRRSASTCRCPADRRAAAGRPGRPGAARAGRERVRRLRRRQGRTCSGSSEITRERRDHGAAHHRRPAGRRDARGRQPGRRTADRVVRLAGRRSGSRPCGSTSRPGR